MAPKEQKTEPNFQLGIIITVITLIMVALMIYYCYHRIQKKKKRDRQIRKLQDELKRTEAEKNEAQLKLNASTNHSDLVLYQSLVNSAEDHIGRLKCEIDRVMSKYRSSKQWERHHKCLMLAKEEQLKRAEIEMSIIRKSVILPETQRIVSDLGGEGEATPQKVVLELIRQREEYQEKLNAAQARNGDDRERLKNLGEEFKNKSNTFEDLRAEELKQRYELERQLHETKQKIEELSKDKSEMCECVAQLRASLKESEVTVCNLSEKMRDQFCAQEQAKRRMCCMDSVKSAIVKEAFLCLQEENDVLSCLYGEICPDNVHLAKEMLKERMCELQRIYGGWKVKLCNSDICD